MNPSITRQVPRICLIFSLALASCTQVLTSVPNLPPTEIPLTTVPTKTLPVNAPAGSSTPVADFQKGIVYTSWWNGEYSSPDSDKTLSERIKPMGVNWLSVVVTCYQEKFNSTEIRCDGTKTPTDSDLDHVIQYAHSLDLKVMLKPHIDLSNDSRHWRGDIGFGNDEAAWKTWLASYAQFISHYATLAQSTNVDYFVVGTELAMTTHHSDDWRKIVEAVKQEYKGPLTYSANHDGEEFSIDWWDQLDAIGVDAYYSLTQTNDPTIAQLTEAWKPVVSSLESLSKKWNRPIIFTEIGYQSRDGVNQTPWNAENDTVDLQEQADCYRAVFEAFAGQEWWQGVFWWNWSISSTQGGALDTDFTANDKPAEKILMENYTGIRP